MSTRWLLGTLVTPDRVVERGAVGIEGDTIAYAGPASGAPRDPRDPAQQVDGWVTPGMIDLHIHGAGGADLMDGTPESVETVARTLAAHGVTGFLATSMVRRELAQNRHLEVAAELTRASRPGASVLGIHVEGPYVNPARAGLIRHDRIWGPDAADVAKLLKFSRGALRMMTMAPELPGALELLPALADQGAVGSLGHTDATFGQARAGFEAGIRHVTHLYNAMRGLHHREPGALGAVLIDNAVTVQLIADGVHVHPEVLRWTISVLPKESIVLVTDALPSAGLPDGTYEYDGRPYEAVNGTAYSLPGTGYQEQVVPGTGRGRLFGTSILMDEMVRRAVRFAGVDFPSAVAMATRNPARTLGLERTLGALAPGRRADIACWDKGLRVVETFVAGTPAQTEVRT